MNPVGSLVCPIIVGRDDLLARAEGWVADARRGDGRTLLIAGEAGVGKTRLARAIYRKAEAAGLRVDGGAVAPHDRNVPLASILDFARGIRADARWGSLGPDLLEICGSTSGDSLGRRRTLVVELADRILQALDRPTVLAFEDVHWTDELSLEVIGELARFAGERSLLVIATYRLDEFPVGSTHREWRARLLSQRLAEEARLQPLSLDETAIATTLILGTGLPAPREVVAAVHDRTNGIPLHIEELLGALPEEARLDGRRIREAHVPDTIEDALLARIGRLSPSAREVARAGAVIGRCFAPDVVAGMLDRPLTELEPAMEELVDAAILHPFQFVDEGYYDFRHQLLRDAIYATLPPAQLRRLHAQAAEFGTSLIGASEIHTSVHFERAGLRSQAYRTALSAARAASSMSSRREAFELYRRAVANIPDGLEAPELAELYRDFSVAAFAIDDMPASVETASLARRYFLEAGRPIEAAEHLIRLSGMARRDVRSPDERRLPLEQAEAELVALPDSRDRTRALAGVRELQLIHAIDFRQLDEAAAAMADLERLSEEGGPYDDADLAFYRSVIDVHAGRAEATGRILDVARRARDANLEETGVTAYRVAAALAIRFFDYGTAAAGLGEGLRYADAIEQSFCRRIMAATSALVAWAAGRWDEAVAIAEIELVERGTRRGTLGSQDALGYVAFGRGDVERARELLSSSLAVGRHGGDVELILPPLWGLAETALVADEGVVAVAHCEEAAAIADSTGERALLIPFVATGVRANLAVRRPEDAAAWADRAERHLAGSDQARPALDHGRGLVAMVGGSLVAARELLEAAVRGWDSYGRTWEAAGARLDLAQCLIRSNRFGEAAPLIATVAGLAEEIGSGPLAARSDDLARTARGRGFDDEPWRPLTAREFEVARLIAEGLTNAEIGDRLEIAPKTASAHVEHILAKLGVSRRAEIATWAATVRGPAATERQGVAMGAGARS